MPAAINGTGPINRWAVTVTGGITLAFIAWMALSVHNLSVQVATMNVELRAFVKRIDQHDDRFTNISSRVRKLESERNPWNHQPE